MLTFEELIVAHPLPWMRTPLSEGYKSLVIRDANDDSVCIRNTDETIVGAANLVGELRQNLAAVTKERDDLRRDLSAMTETANSLHDELETAKSVRDEQIQRLQVERDLFRTERDRQRNGYENENFDLSNRLASVVKERNEFQEVAMRMPGDYADLKAKCARLEADRDGHVRSIELLTKRLDHLMTRRDCISHEVRLTNDETDRRRHEAACAIYAAWLSRGMFSCEPDAVAPTVIRHTDALLAELAKGRPDATAEPTPGVSLIEVLAGTKDDLIDADNYPAAAKVRDFMDWLEAGCPRLFNWPAFGIQDIPEAPVEAKEWRIGPSKGDRGGYFLVSPDQKYHSIDADRPQAERIVKLLNGG